MSACLLALSLAQSLNVNKDAQQVAKVTLASNDDVFKSKTLPNNPPSNLYCRKTRIDFLLLPLSGENITLRVRVWCIFGSPAANTTLVKGTVAKLEMVAYALILCPCLWLARRELAVNWLVERVVNNTGREQWRERWSCQIQMINGNFYGLLSKMLVM